MSKTYKNIDDLFRDKFEHYEVDPPAHIWDHVKAGISGNAGKGSGFNLKNGGIAGITLLLISLGIITFFLINNAFVVPDELSEAGSFDADYSATALIADHTPEVGSTSGDAQTGSLQQTEAVPTTRLEPERTYKTVVAGGDDKKEKRQKVRGTNPKRNASLIISPDLTAQVPAERIAQRSLNAQLLAAPAVGIPESNPMLISQKDEESLNHSTGEADPVAGLAATASSSEILRGQTGLDSEPKKRQNKRNDYGQKSPWSMGVYFTPEMIVYPSDDQLRNYSYSLDLNATYKPGKYFMQSGIGFSRNHDQGNRQVNFNKYLGSYEDVYNVTFDTTASGVVPVYHTETVDVYDSIKHVIISPSKRHFTYLQIPLFFGYGEESKRFGWFVKGGPSISFLVHEDIPQSTFSEMEAKVLTIENELPGRINTNWQFILTAGATYKLGPQLSISLEPMFRYYIKSVYEQDKLNTKHPYSVGLRTGFLLNF